MDSKHPSKEWCLKITLQDSGSGTNLNLKTLQMSSHSDEELPLLQQAESKADRATPATSNLVSLMGCDDGADTLIKPIQTHFALDGQSVSPRTNR